MEPPSALVIPMPTPLATLAQQLREDVAATIAIHTQYVESMLRLGAHLREARERFDEDDRAFGIWLAQEEIGMSAMDRSRMITMAAEPEIFRGVLIEQTEALHAQTIWLKYQSRFTYITHNIDPKHTQIPAPNAEKQEPDHPIKPNDRRRARLPADGSKLSDRIRQGMTLEHSKHLIRANAAKQVNIPIQTYIVGRDIVTLLDNVSLLPADHAVCKQALDLFDRGYVSQAHRQVVEIAQKMFGIKKQRRAPRAQNNTQRQSDAFQRILVMICETCEHGANATVPDLPPDKIKMCIRDLLEARKYVSALIEKLREEQHETQDD